VTDSTRAAKKLDKDVSRALGGSGSAVCEGPHQPGQLRHSHAEVSPGGNRFPGHTFVDSSLTGILVGLKDIFDVDEDGEISDIDILDLANPFPYPWWNALNPEGA